MFFVTSLNAQIKVWNNNHTTIGWANAPHNEQLNINGTSYQVPAGSVSGGFFFENYPNATFNEPCLRPDFALAMWIGQPNYEIYRIFTDKLYTTDGTVQMSDRRMKSNVREWEGSALNKVMKLNVYRYDLNTSKYKNVPEEKKAQIALEGMNKIGFIAQELEVEFPEVVHSIPGTVNVGVDYTMMIPVLLEAIKEQQKIISKLQSRVEALESE